MAMNLGCNIRQTARRFVAAAGTGGILRSPTGLAGASQQARSCHSLNNQSSNYGLTFIETARGLLLKLPNLKSAPIVLFGLSWYLDSYIMRMTESARCPTCKDEAQRKRTEEKE